MTLNLGWVSESAVYLVADTSRTVQGPSNIGITSLGQRCQRDDGLAVEDVAAKLVPLGNHAAAALCGDAAGATALVTKALKSIKLGVPVREALVQAGHSVHLATPPFGNIFVLVAIWDSGPRLLIYDSRSLDLTDASHSGPITVGSLRQEFQEGIKAAVRRLPRPGPPREYALAPALAVLHSLAASENLIEDKVGGVFYGLQIDADGLHWQPSLLYAFHDDRPDVGTAPPWNIVNCRILDGVCTVGSSLTRQVRCLVPSGIRADRVSWMSRWEASLGTKAALEACRAVAFIRTLGGSVVLLPNDGAHFRWFYDNDDLNFAFSPELDSRLRWRPSPDRPYSYSLGLPPPEQNE
jgi:hypothetical protein